MAKSDNVEQTLNALFDAERKVRQLHDDIVAGNPNAVMDHVEKAMKKASDEPNEDEATLRLERLAGLLGEFEGPRAVDLLIDILASELPGAREAAGSQLEGLAFDRFKEVAKGIERALKRLPVASPALPELPYLLAEVAEAEPGVVKLLQAFMTHADADAVAAAIEVAVIVGDPSLVSSLEKLQRDNRTVEMSNEQGEEGEVTIGELALDAIDLLEGVSEEDGEGAEPPPKNEQFN